MREIDGRVEGHTVAHPPPLATADGGWEGLLYAVGGIVAQAIYHDLTGRFGVEQALAKGTRDAAPATRRSRRRIVGCRCPRSVFCPPWEYICAASGRGSNEEITTFDSTGLAIQDLAIALAAIGRADELDLPTIEL